MTVQSLDESTDPLCLTDGDARTLLEGAPWRRFGVVGDSLSLGTGGPSPGYRDLGWSDRVAELLGAGNPWAAYLNLARIGATTPETIDSQMERMLDFGPDLLHLPCGANDLVRREPDFGEIERATRAMYERAGESGALLMTFTLGRAYVVPVFDDWEERVKRMNAITRAVALEHGAIVIDFWDHPVNARPELVSDDGIHFSTMGQAVMAAEVVRALAGSQTG